MAARPTWIIQDLAEVLGFDEATVAEAILPELETQNNQTRLQSHLQDFLGPSPKARSFITRYIALRFPQIPTPTPAPPPSLKPQAYAARSSSQVASGSRTPLKPSPSSTPDLGRAVSEAFGSGGTVYTKNAQADSARGSGSNTPQFRQAGRPGGALSIHEGRSREGKGKGKAEGKGDRIWDVPKSREVKRLEGLKEKLIIVQDGGKASRENEIPDCFCQARVHHLSAYTPQCPDCGLVLCELQMPYLPCPNCQHSLYTPAQLARLLLRLTNDIEAQLGKEQDARDAEERERRDRLLAESGGGAFPTLPGGAPSRGGSGANTPANRKVITIGKGGKGKTTLTTTTYKPVSQPSTPSEPSVVIPTDIVPRPRSPPLDATKVEKEVNKVESWRKTEDRPWGDMKAEKRGDTLSYIEVPLSQWVDEGTEGRRKTAKKKKKEASEEARAKVPGAV